MKVGELIKYLDKFNQDIDIYFLEQFCDGVDGEMMGLNEKVIDVDTIKNMCKKNKGLIVYMNNDTFEDEKILIFNYKDNKYSKLDMINEEEEKRVQKAEEEVEMEEIII